MGLCSLLPAVQGRFEDHMQITVRYSGIDRARIVRRFASIEAARKFAIKYVGAYPEIGCGYAVSGDGVGKVTVNGCTLTELFHAPANDCSPLSKLFDEYHASEDAADEADAIAYNMFGKRAAEWDRQIEACRPAGCTCSDMQLARVGCECGQGMPF